MKKYIALLLVFISILSCLALCGCTPKLESISINPKSVELEKGEAKVLDLSFEPQKAKHGEITWNSSDPDVVTVDEDGYIKGVAVGNAVVSAKSDEGIKATCKVTVKAPKPQVLELSAQEATINVGETLELTYTLEPVDADTSLLTWSSSDEAVATVNNGVVTPIAEGSAVITLSSAEGVNASCSITVEDRNVFSLLTNYTIENGTLGSSGDCYTWASEPDPEMGGDRYGTMYYPDKEYILLIIYAELDSSTVYVQIAVPFDKHVPYDVIVVYRNLSSSLLDGRGHMDLYPERFTSKSSLTFAVYEGSSGMKPSIANYAGPAVGLCLQKISEITLEPNGYTLADLGFTSF